MSRVNLILITVECWRSDCLGESTPNMARFGGESAVFEHAHAGAGWTLPSMTSLMSSAYASMFGGCEAALATPQRQVLAECLLHNGYWTAGFTANPICGISGGFHRGFGKFYDERRVPDVAPEQRGWRRMVELGIAPCDLDPYWDAAHMTDQGLKWVAGRKPDQPYFLWIHYMDPHWPCFTAERPANLQELHDAWHDRHVFKTEVVPRRGQYDPGDEMRNRWIHRYRQAVTATDREIGRLLDDLRLRPDWNRTVVAITGDHGEELYEHGTWHHAWNKLYREGIEVPLILRVPGGAEPQRVSQPVSHLDIAPTLLDYAEAAQRHGVPPMMGTSLRPLIERRQLPGRPVYSEMMSHPNSSSYMLAIFEGEWKYIYDLDDPHHSKLFHIADDPAELNDVRGAHPEIFRRFERMRFSHVSLGLTAIMRRHNSEEPRYEMDDVVKEQMIALGYMAAG